MPDPSPSPSKQPPDNITEKEDEKDKKAAKDEPLASLSEVWSFARAPKTKLFLMAGCGCAIVSGLVFPAMAFFFATVFEDLSADNGDAGFLSSIREIAISFMILGVIAFTFMTLQSALCQTAAEEMAQTLKVEWFRAILRQDMAYYDIQKDISGTATLISINGNKFKKGLGPKLAEGIQFTITLFGGMAYAFYASWRTSLVVLAVVPFMSLSTAFLLKMNQSQTARANASYAKAGSIVYTAVSSIRTILALNAVDRMIEQFASATQEAYTGSVSQVFLVGLANGSVMGSFLLAYIPVTLYGAYLLYDNVESSGCDPSGANPFNESCTPPAVGVFGALMGITFAGAVLPQVTVTIEAFTGARSACYPALQTMKRKIDNDDDCNQADKPSAVGKNGNGTNGSDEEEVSEVDEVKAIRRGDTTCVLPKYIIDSSSDKGLKPANVVGNVEFQDVSFAYPTRREINVFDGFNLSIPAGKTVALVGPSGSGKSTTVHLLERFYDPQHGSITLDGTDLKELNVGWLRKQIGLVSQEPKLFALSIKENIAIGCDEDVTMEQIEAAAKKANAHDFIQSFPNGYDTQVGDEGTQLSGGQKQRIAIARVLIKKPKLLLLDEATSALDSESEAVVQAALDKLMKEGNQTIVVIAHRLSTIRKADIIAVVKGGKIVETGSHDELLSKQGAYYDLIEAQKGNKKSEDDKNIDETNNNENGESNNDDEEDGIDDDKEFKKQQSAVDESVEIEAKNVLASGTPVIHFENVHFTYPSRPDNKVFRGLDLAVREGETLAIVGPSGQGKSTIIQLIENFYRPTEGVVKYRGVDMKDINVRWLRDQLGLVSQEPILFDTTIAENICFGHSQATQDDIEEAAKQANAHDFIMSFPDGYKTEVGAGSTQVSGGQKQRIAIARALLRKPKVLLLDEATSALDSESERVVQAALDKIMADKSQTTIVIAHRLSTIRDADRIAVIDHGKVREIGSHDELMSHPNGSYRRLQQLQNLDADVNHADLLHKSKGDDGHAEKADETKEEKKEETKAEAGDNVTDADLEKQNAAKARALARGDEIFFIVGSIGAILAGIMFPGWGFIFAYMIELLYTYVLECDDKEGSMFPPPPGYSTCEEFWEDSANDMQQKSIDVFLGLIGIVVAAVVGNVLLFWGFGTATERMNKRVRDSAFNSLVRQEISWFDLRPVGTITTQLSDDAAMVHSFSGEPIRTLVMNMASVVVGLVVSFVFMWPFALMTLAILPFMSFGAEAEMQMYMGEDEADVNVVDKNSPGGIIIETLLNIRTVASLCIEETRATEYATALVADHPTPFRTNVVKGSTSGLGQFIQMWGIALMFWWGGWLLSNYSIYTFRDYLISMFSLLFSLSGMAFAMQGITDREKAKAAANRVFALIDRTSEIDPLSDKGRVDL